MLEEAPAPQANASLRSNITRRSRPTAKREPKKKPRGGSGATGGGGGGDKGKNEQAGDGKKACDNCGRTNHTTAECFYGPDGKKKRREGGAYHDGG